VGIAGRRWDIAAFQNHLADPDAVIERLLPFDVVCVMRERSPLPRNVIERLPNLKLIASTGPVNASIDVAARAITGSHWFTRGIGRTRRSNLPGR
jgi:phosphoglycerate dehydrogenase-like enzyme